MKSGRKRAVAGDEPAADRDEADAEETASSSGGGQHKPEDWRARKHRSLWVETTIGRALLLIDQVHRRMQSWGSDVVKVNGYLDSRGQRGSQVFAQLIHALSETNDPGSEQRSIRESLHDHLRALGSRARSEPGLGG